MAPESTDRPMIIWRDGDSWRDLSDEAVNAGQVTVVSENGTARLLDFNTGRQARIPLEGGHRMSLDSTPKDLRWRPLVFSQLTPCGLSLWKEMGSPVRLVLVGLHANWTVSSVGRDVVNAVMARRPRTAPGHSPTRCRAAYCPVPNSET